MPNGAAFPWPHPWHAPDSQVSGPAFATGPALAAGTLDCGSAVVNAVDLAYPVDLGPYGVPDPPPKPDPPDYFVGRGTFEADASRVVRVTRVRPSVCAFTGRIRVMGWIRGSIGHQSLPGAPIHLVMRLRVRTD